MLTLVSGIVVMYRTLVELEQLPDLFEVGTRGGPEGLRAGGCAGLKDWVASRGSAVGAEDRHRLRCKEGEGDCSPYILVAPTVLLRRPPAAPGVRVVSTCGSGSVIPRRSRCLRGFPFPLGRQGRA